MKLEAKLKEEELIK